MALLRYILQRTKRHWQMFLTVSLGVILATALLASAPLLVDVVVELGLHATLRMSDPAVGNLRLSTHVRLGQQEAGQLEELDAQVRAMLGERFGTYLDRTVLSVSSYWLFPWVEGQTARDQRVNLRTYEGIVGELEFVDGKWPTVVGKWPAPLDGPLASSSEPVVVQVLIGEEMAEHYDLRVDDRLPLSLKVDDGQPAIWLEVSGIARTSDLRSP